MRPPASTATPDGMRGVLASSPPSRTCQPLDSAAALAGSSRLARSSATKRRTMGRSRRSMALADGEDNVSSCSAMLRWLLRVWIQLPGPVRYAYLRLRYGHYGVGMAALIHDERGRIMVVHRTYSRDEPWALPGGWLEGGDEGLEGGLERELFEETGL